MIKSSNFNIFYTVTKGHLPCHFLRRRNSSIIYRRNCSFPAAERDEMLRFCPSLSAAIIICDIFSYYDFSSNLSCVYLHSDRWRSVMYSLSYPLPDQKLSSQLCRVPLLTSVRYCLLLSDAYSLNSLFLRCHTASLCRWLSFLSI